MPATFLENDFHISAQQEILHNYFVLDVLPQAPNGIQLRTVRGNEYKGYIWYCDMIFGVG